MTLFSILHGLKFISKVLVIYSTSWFSIISRLNQFFFFLSFLFIFFPSLRVSPSLVGDNFHARLGFSLAQPFKGGNEGLQSKPATKNMVLKNLLG